LVLCCADAIAPVSLGSAQFSPVDTTVVNLHNDTLVVIYEFLLRNLAASAGRGTAMVPPGQQATDTETARVIARPPFLFLACLILGFVLDRVLPAPFSLPEAALVRWMAGGVLIVLGVAIFAAGIRNFSRAATPVPSTRPVYTLVTTGIHGWSRNPIYVGMLLIYAGIGIAASSPWILILTLPLAITIRYGVVVREEVYLERRFGDAYRDYKVRVRRWL
jgi:protein-S-isoprenylcysteine O-methyltransferase Ste14